MLTCICLYFSKKNQSYDDFVYSLLSVGGILLQNVIDIQLDPVRLLFIKFSDQLVRDEVVGRLQAGLLWTLSLAGPRTSPWRGSGYYLQVAQRQTKLRSEIFGTVWRNC